MRLDPKDSGVSMLLESLIDQAGGKVMLMDALIRSVIACPGYETLVSYFQSSAGVQQEFSRVFESVQQEFSRRSNRD